MRLATGMDLTNGSDFKLLDRKVVNALLLFGERETFFRGINQWVGFKSTTVFFQPDERFAGKSGWSQFKKIRLAIVTVTSFSSAPIKLVALSAIGLITLSAYAAIGVLINVSTGSAIEGFATVILLQILLTTLLMTTQMILAIYIYRIYEEVKGRPRYIISQTIENP